MDSSQWTQGIGSVVKCGGADESPKKARPEKEKALNCRRCSSTNTKFCYYNNYSLSQPRYFCKTCRRYWTEGGSLRNVPVGGGSRKNCRRPSSSSSPASCKKFPLLHQGHHDLNLAYDPPPIITNSNISDILNLNPNSTAALETLKNGVSSFMSMPPPDQRHHVSNPTIPTMFLPSAVPYSNLHDDGKPNGCFYNFSLGGFGIQYGNLLQESAGGAGSARLFFPNLEDVKQQVSIMGNDHHQFGQQSRGQVETTHDANGYWNGMLGGGGGGSSW